MERAVSRAVMVLLAILGASACDNRRVVRTVVRAEGSRPITEQCIAAGLEETREWQLQREAGKGFVVWSKRADGPSLNLSLMTEGQHSVVAIEAALITGKPDEPRALKELESAERSVAGAIVNHCAQGSIVSCWDSDRKVESPRCFP